MGLLWWRLGSSLVAILGSLARSIVPCSCNAFNSSDRGFTRLRPVAGRKRYLRLRHSLLPYLTIHECGDAWTRTAFGSAPITTIQTKKMLYEGKNWHFLVVNHGGPTGGSGSQPIIVFRVFVSDEFGMISSMIEVRRKRRLQFRASQDIPVFARRAVILWMHTCRQG